MEPGTFAVDPEPFGPPWPLWDEVGAEEAEARGVYAPVYSLSYGPRGVIGVALGDVRGTVLIPEWREGYCCGVAGMDGPNLACAECGGVVATLVDDCSCWQVVWLDPRAVRTASAGGRARPLVSWDDLRLVDPPEAWEPWWEAAVAVTLARLLAVSGGVRVTVTDGPVAECFRRSLDTLLPAAPPMKGLALAGPRLPTTVADIVLVPQHPQTGEAWPSSAERTVPLAADVWMYLAFHDDRRLLLAASRLPDGVRRDDPLPLLPIRPFRPDRDTFLHALARLPEVRQPWLRAIYDRVIEDGYSFPF